MSRFFLIAASFLFCLPLAHADYPGQLTNLALTVTFGNSPGTDQVIASGSRVQGAGAPALNFPADVVVVSFDNGHFVQTIPTNSFTSISGGWKFTSTSSGVQLLKIMNDGTWNLTVKQINLTGTNNAQMGALAIAVGQNTFSVVPNSPPVGKITGPASATVGSLVTLDASSSTDFNSNPLTYTWSIVSQPLGSSATLSSTNQATTSLTVTKNGAYVLKCVPNDGIVNGVPALVTVNVTGESTPPSPAPGPDNGLIVLSSDLNSYIAGQSATLSLHVNVPDGNGARRYYFAATYDDQPVTLTQITSQVDYSFVTPVFADVGSHTFKVLQYTETTDISNDLDTAIKNYNSDIAACNKALQYETNPTVIAQLQAQIASDQAQIAIDQQKQIDNRTQVAGPAVLSVIVN